MILVMETKRKTFSITAHGRLVEYTRPVVMGILNITDDSFYDGGRHREPEAMLRHARWLLDEGADIVDVGASSSRPGATLLPPDEEARRLTEAITLLRKELPDTVLSVDTCYSTPARAAIKAVSSILSSSTKFLRGFMGNHKSSFLLPFARASAVSAHEQESAACGHAEHSACREGRAPVLFASAGVYGL